MTPNRLMSMTACIRWKTAMAQAVRVAAVMDDVIHTMK